jgi:hypothetical protein
MSKKEGRCAYCASDASRVTRDHVIPLLLFTKPFPPNLITVPACKKCQAEKQVDDEFLRDYLTCDVAAGQHPIASAIRLNKTYRAVERNSSEFARFVVTQQRRKVPLVTAAGIFAGVGVYTPLPLGRVESVITRITRGLYYAHQKRIMPSNTAITVLLRNLSDFETLLGALGRRHQVHLGSVFSCAYCEGTIPMHSLWLMLFYERLLFSVLTTPSKAA